MSLSFILWFSHILYQLTVVFFSWSHIFHTSVQNILITSILYYYKSKINADLQRFQDWWLSEPTPSESWPNSSLDVSLQLYLQDLNKHVLLIILDKVSTYEVLLESLALVSLRKKRFFDMLILDHKSFEAATPYYISALFTPRTNINGLGCSYRL